MFNAQHMRKRTISKYFKVECEDQEPTEYVIKMSVINALYLHLMNTSFENSKLVLVLYNIMKLRFSYLNICHIIKIRERYVKYNIYFIQKYL